MCSLGSLYIKILEIGCVVLSWRAGGAPGAHAPCDGTRSVTTVLCACGEVSLYLLVVSPAPSGYHPWSAVALRSRPREGDNQGRTHVVLFIFTVRARPRDEIQVSNWSKFANKSRDMITCECVLAALRGCGWFTSGSLRRNKTR